MESMILIAKMILVAHQAAWLTLGVRDNIVHPIMNAQFTAQVMTLERMQELYPAEYELMKGRAITNPVIHKFLFGGVIFIELFASFALWAGVIALGLSIFDIVNPETASIIALIGTLAFTSVWASFLVVGNHFSYWFCHDGAQNTHFQMTIWGTATTIFICLTGV